jgi:hypothetical protein
MNFLQRIYALLKGWLFCSATVGPRDRLAHQTLSDAYRTVRCAQPTVGTGHVSRVDRAADRWPLAQLAHRTVRCTTGQSGEL